MCDSTEKMSAASIQRKVGMVVWKAERRYRAEVRPLPVWFWALLRMFFCLLHPGFRWLQGWWVWFWPVYRSGTGLPAASELRASWYRWWDWGEPDCFLYPAQAAQPVQAQRWAARHFWLSCRKSGRVLPPAALRRRRNWMCGVHGRPGGGHGRRFRFGWTGARSHAGFSGKRWLRRLSPPGGAAFPAFCFCPGCFAFVTFPWQALTFSFPVVY